MAVSRLKILPLVLSTLSITMLWTVVGCGKGTAEPSTAKMLISDHPPVLVGSLLENVQSQAKSEYREKCDLIFDSLKLELAKALDERAEAIAAFSMTNASDQSEGTEEDSSRAESLKIGPATIRALTKKAHLKDEWKTEVENWQSAYRAFLEIKDQPINEDWVNLNSEVRSLLMDDEKRLDGYISTLARDSLQVLQGMKAAIARCLADVQCASPSFNKKALSLIKDSWQFNFYRKQLKQREKTHKEKRELLSHFAERVESAMSNYEIVKNPAIRREGSTFILPLDIGEFEGAQEQIASFVEPVYSKPGLKLKIQWVEPQADIYRMLFGRVVGQRSYVMHSSHTVMVSDFDDSSVFPHELGHVIGLRDSYYTVWRPQKCIYEVQSNEADLMSDSVYGGGVTASEWVQIEQAYPRH